MKLSALVLAGGKSSRMGRDKAWLEIDGQSLIERQLALARELGAEELFISGRAREDYSSLGFRVLEDAFPDAGPLAGIERGLAATTSPLLLVLAVDLPRMETHFLRRLLATCADDRGAVPEVRGRLEPLAAMYPRCAHAVVALQLQAGRCAVHEFAAACEAEGWLQRYPVTAADEPLFLNWNTPEDLTAGKPAQVSRPSHP
jgi:molybdopterin-guanine dinucleotide biosynthesis protein A